jgi:hypothetical protein
MSIGKTFNEDHELIKKNIADAENVKKQKKR